MNNQQKSDGKMAGSIPATLYSTIVCILKQEREVQTCTTKTGISEFTILMIGWSKEWLS